MDFQCVIFWVQLECGRMGVVQRIQIDRPISMALIMYMDLRNHNSTMYLNYR